MGQVVRGRLTFRRKLGERVVIGEGDAQIVVEVVAVGSTAAKVLIDAPRSVPVYREELGPVRRERS